MKYLTHLGAGLLAASILIQNAQAGHVYAGIIDTNGVTGLQSGDALAFVVNTGSNAGQAITGESLGLQNMSLVSVGAQAGLYLTSNISFTALSDGRAWTGSAYMAANPFAALSGSYIEMQIASVTGPTGGQFSFWDTEVSTTAPASTYTVGSGITLGSGYINLTDPSLIVGDGVTTSPAPTTVQGTTGVDPYGHVHGRTYTVNTPGTYTVQYILHDANGVQADSAPFTVTYYAVPEPTTVAMVGLGGITLIGAIMRQRSKKN